MSERDVLNPQSMWDNDIQDNPCPDYGFTRTRPDLLARAKGPGGSPMVREVQNDGHKFRLSWLNRSYLCAQRIAWFAARFERSYFTLIDQDGGGRHYVGRFTGDLPIVQQGNLSYSLQDLTFEEYPGAPMLVYPNDWQRDGIFLDAVECTGQQNAATTGTWTAGTWDDGEGTVLSTLTDTGTANDFATMEYRGYGVKLIMLQGPNFGQAQVYLDNVLQETIDLYASAALGPQEVWVREDIPLNLHRVKVVALGTKNAASSAAAISLVRLAVMR